MLQVTECLAGKAAASPLVTENPQALDLQAPSWCIQVILKILVCSCLLITFIAEWA